MAASTMIMDRNNQMTFYLLNLLDLKSLTRCWRSVLELGRKGVSPLFENIGSQYIRNIQRYIKLNIL